VDLNVADHCKLVDSIVRRYVNATISFPNGGRHNMPVNTDAELASIPSTFDLSLVTSRA